MLKQIVDMYENGYTEKVILIIIQNNLFLHNMFLIWTYLERWNVNGC